MFTSQSAAIFYDKLFSSLDFTLPGAATGRRGFPKEAMVCAFIVMKCEGFSQITDLADYLDNNRTSRPPAFSLCTGIFFRNDPIFVALMRIASV